VDFKSGIFVESKSGNHSSLSASDFTIPNLGIVAEKDDWSYVILRFIHTVDRMTSICQHNQTFVPLAHSVGQKRPLE
jgi:hypothetical protein